MRARPHARPDTASTPAFGRLRRLLPGCALVALSLAAGCNETDTLKCPPGVSTCEPARRPSFVVAVPPAGPGIAGIQVNGPCSAPEFAGCDAPDAGSCAHSVRLFAEPSAYADSGPTCTITLRAPGAGATTSVSVGIRWMDRRCCVNQQILYDLYIDGAGDAAEPVFNLAFPAR